ncbi:MAG: hypothetical protein IPG97_16165 [Microthrixaceae bacterium]|nr:hypothetical protein [Microthrixaceae bacterium]
MSETDDLTTRARRHAETHPESRELIEELLEELLEAVVRWACFAARPPVPPWPDGVLRDAANRLRWIANSATSRTRESSESSAVGLTNWTPPRPAVAGCGAVGAGR